MSWLEWQLINVTELTDSSKAAHNVCEENGNVWIPQSFLVSDRLDASESGDFHIAADPSPHADSVCNPYTSSAALTWRMGGVTWHGQSMKRDVNTRPVSAAGHLCVVMRDAVCVLSGWHRIRASIISRRCELDIQAVSTLAADNDIVEKIS